MNRSSRKLGISGISVNPIGLGTAHLSIEGRPSEPDAIKVICAALDSGINFIDTADAYCLNDDDFGYSERLIAKALRQFPQNSDVIIATKGGMVRPDGACIYNGKPEYLKKACEASLKSLNIDCISLYQLHAPDVTVSFLESVQALAKLKEQGKIQFIGLSNVSLNQVKEARKIVEIVSVQNLFNPYNISDFQNGLISYCEIENIAFLPYSPVGGPSAKVRTLKDPFLNRIAKLSGLNPFQVILVCLITKFPTMIPIPGARKIQSVLDSAAVMKINFSADLTNEIDRYFLK